MLSSHPLYQLSLKFPNQAHAKREFFEQNDSVPQRDHVVSTSRRSSELRSTTAPAAASISPQRGRVRTICWIRGRLSPHKRP